MDKRDKGRQIKRKERIKKKKWENGGKKGFIVLIL